MMKRLILFLQFLLLNLGIFAQSGEEGVHFLEGVPWENVLEMAGKQDKHIFMDCFTSWCGPCKALAKNVFTKKETGDFFNARFVCVKYDMEKGEGKKLKELFKDNIIGYPTLLLINSKGEVVHCMAGFHEADELISGIKAGLEGKTIFKYNDKYTAGERSLPFIKEYVEVLNAAFMKDKISEVVNEYMNSLSLEKLKEPEVWELVQPFVKDPYSPQFEYVASNFDYFTYKLKGDCYRLERQLNWALEKALEKIIELQKDTNGVILPLLEEPQKLDLLKSLIKRMNLKRAEKYLAKIHIYELEIRKKWDEVFKCLEVCRDIEVLGYSDLYVDRVMQYVAVNCKDRKLLKRGVEWMEELEEKAKDGKYRFKENYNGTLALLYKQLNNNKKAEKYSKLDEEIKEQNRLEFEKMMKEKN